MTVNVFLKPYLSKTAPKPTRPKKLTMNPRVPARLRYSIEISLFKVENEAAIKRP